MSSASNTRDSEFFIDVKPLYLLVEDTLFCVPRHYFQTSVVFERMLTRPESRWDGSSEEHPLFLKTIDVEEFREFLRVLSSRFTMSNNTADGVTVDSWLVVLKLASAWQFRGLREEALRCLKAESCVIRIQVARQYHIQDWLIPAIKQLIDRGQALTGDEITRLGAEFAGKVMALREESCRSRIDRDSSGEITDDTIIRKFQGDFGASV